MIGKIERPFLRASGSMTGCGSLGSQHRSFSRGVVRSLQQRQKTPALKTSSAPSNVYTASPREQEASEGTTSSMGVLGALRTDLRVLCSVVFDWRAT